MGEFFGFGEDLEHFRYNVPWQVGFLGILKLICRKLLMQPTRCANAFARDSPGSSKAARLAMMAITTSSSMNERLRLDNRG
jgi:hypothetical protein